MGKRKSAPKHSKAIGGLIAAAVVLTAADDAARMATDGTASGTHALDALGFLPPPDPPVDKTKTVEEQVAELEVHRDLLIADGHIDLADSVQAKINALEEGKAPSQKKKRRSRDALGTTAHEKRYAGSSLSYGGQGWMLAGDRARTDPQSLYQQQRTKAKKAVAAAWRGYQEWKESGVTVNMRNGEILTIAWEPDEEGAASSSYSSMSAGMSTARKYAIQYLYVEQFGAPEEGEWDDFHPTSSLPTLIMRLLGIPAGSRGSVVKAMRDIHEANEAGELYDPSKGIKAGRGRKALIEDLTPQAEVVYRSMESGLSLGNTLTLVNQWRRVRSMPPLSYGALQRFVKASQVMVLEKRHTKKSGKDDKTTNWAVARLAFCKQLLRQLAKAVRMLAAAHGTGGGATYVAAEDGDDKQQADLERPLHVDGIVYWDEHHRQIRLGHSSKYEARVRRDANGDFSASGSLPKKMDTTSVKYPDEARGAFGCCIRTDSQTGVREGVRLPVFNYTGQWLHGIKRWNEEFEKERKRVLDMPRKFGGKGKGYEDVPGAGAIQQGTGNPLLDGKPLWHTKIHEVLTTRSQSACRCVTELIDHMVIESKKAYVGTDREGDFLIYHDALSVFTETEAQAYLASQYPDMAGRFIASVGTTNQGTSYHGRCVGDSPELCRGLDSHGFADLDYAVSFCCSLASVYPRDDERRRRWNQGTKKQLFGVMEAVWLNVAPTSERVIEDLEYLPTVVKKIIEYDGAVVPDEVIRSGRRALSEDDRAKAPTKTRNPSARDKISTQKAMIVHEDLKEAELILLGNDNDDDDDDGGMGD